MEEKQNMYVVTCRCDSNHKQNIAKMIKSHMIWSECGGMETLEGIVRQKLSR